MTFEFDPPKSAANKAKHGIDFEQAQALWRDRDLLILQSNRPSVGELRRLAIGTIEGRLWTAVITRRGVVIRIISVRRARRYEEANYEQARKNRYTRADQR